MSELIWALVVLVFGGTFWFTRSDHRSRKRKAKLDYDEAEVTYLNALRDMNTKPKEAAHDLAQEIRDSNGDPSNAAADVLQIQDRWNRRSNGGPPGSKSN